MAMGFLTSRLPKAKPAAPAPMAEQVQDDETFDMANLPRKDTGIDGMIYISTAQGAHGPRVKWYPDRPGREVPCLTVTLEDPARVINHGLPERQVAGAGPQIVAWVTLNRQALQEFWRDGIGWTRDEVSAFIDGLAKLP